MNTMQATARLCSLMQNAENRRKFHERLSKMSRRLENGCIIWTGKVDKDGYGYMKVSGKAVRPHKLSFLLHGGVLTEAKPWVLHDCHNPTCMNPAHLHAGGHLDNEAEKVAAGRQARGTTIYNSKLTPGRVSRIRRAFETGEFTKQRLADEHGVARQTIHKIIKGAIWKLA